MVNDVVIPAEQKRRRIPVSSESEWREKRWERSARDALPSET